MSYCRKEGKDTIIFATAEDHKIPSSVSLPEPEPQPGLILPSGEINWGCPCLGGMATGPCGVQFREAFSCFHYSEAEPKGSDCYEVFKTMQECMSKYPSLYNKDDDGDLPGEGKGDSAAGEETSVPALGKSETDLKPM
ncbi:mitochondrial intermembrane space import and assembly protein 40 [Bacillus rossius redtenbacheri]|uniref:mitochondrial intermembrane space import and assembly protein 40 n=1 Tax=Bacillus rossius redtenbacheri TaxID=93214 RepID=UPI002FDC9EBD